MDIIKKALLNLLPYGLVRRWRSRHSIFSNPFENWAQAAKSSTGYAAQNILHATEQATLKVLSGEAAYSRDSVCFKKIQYSPLLLSGLLLAAVNNNNSVNVLDFGGALGSTYLQNRTLLDKLAVKWNIIEQPHFVEKGQSLFPDGDCHFYHTIADCLQENSPNVIILSSVLPYLEHKDTLVAELLEVEANYIIVDRTVTTEKGEDLVVVQTVPARIYEASYPSWIISRPRLLETFATGYSLLFEDKAFTDSVTHDTEYSEKCFVFCRKGC